MQSCEENSGTSNRLKKMISNVHSVMKKVRNTNGLNGIMSGLKDLKKDNKDLNEDKKDVKDN